MNARNFGKMAVLIVGLVCVSAGYVWADKLGLQEKLSKNVKIGLNDVTIAEALSKIGEKAKVKFVLSDQAVWKLPYGEATRLSVVLDGPLADSMTEMLNAFFMRYAVGDGEIMIYPREELEHILGRSTTKQLEILKAVYTEPIELYYYQEAQKSINDAIGHEVLISPILVQEQINDLLRQLVGETPRYVWKRGRKDGHYDVKSIEERQEAGERMEFQLPTPVTIVQLLNQVSVENREPKFTKWYLSGADFPDQTPEIRVVSNIDFRQAKLDQVIDVSFKEEKAETIIQKLANWTGMQLLVNKREAEWLSQTISVEMQNITLRQAILNIVSMVDGGISITTQNNEIVIAGPEHRKKPAAPKATKGGGKATTGTYVGKISIPMDGGRYYIEFMLRENDLTEQLKKLRAEKIKEVLGKSPTKPKGG